MTELPENVKNHLKEIRDFGDTEFADMVETVVKYYMAKIDNLNDDPSLLIEHLTDMLYEVNEGLEEEKE